MPFGAAAYLVSTFQHVIIFMIKLNGVFNWRVYNFNNGSGAGSACGYGWNYSISFISTGSRFVAIMTLSEKADFVFDGFENPFVKPSGQTARPGYGIARFEIGWKS